MIKLLTGFIIGWVLAQLILFLTLTRIFYPVPMDNIPGYKFQVGKVQYQIMVRGIDP
jgi:hypothetical protein